jgi:hypothetical protein
MFEIIIIIFQIILHQILFRNPAKHSNLFQFWAKFYNFMFAVINSVFIGGT